MANHHLLQALHHITPDEAERFFGDEYTVAPPDPSVPLAPVKRVAIVAESFLPKVDGVSKTAFLTLRYLQRTGREVIVFAPDSAPQSIGGTRVIPLPSVGWARVPESRMALPHPSVARHIEAFKPDLVHLFSPALLSLTGVTVGRQQRIPVVANYQTDLPAYSNYYKLSLISTALRDALRYLHNRCHLTLAPSQYTIDQLRGYGFHRLRHWGRGVNADHFTPTRRSQAVRERLLNGRDPSTLIALFVGRLAPEKHVDALIEVARTPGIMLAIVGDGGERPELERLFAGSNVEFVGYQYGTDLADVYASADAFTFAGAVETFGQVVQEAMASGLPCVVVNQGGVMDLVHDGDNGFVVPLEPQAFADAVIRLRDDAALLRQQAIRSREMAANRPWAAVMAQLEDHYREAIEINRRLERLRVENPNILARIIQLGSTPGPRRTQQRVS